MLQKGANEITDFFRSCRGFAEGLTFRTCTPQALLLVRDLSSDKSLTSR